MRFLTSRERSDSSAARDKPPGRKYNERTRANNVGISCKFPRQDSSRFRSRRADFSPFALDDVAACVLSDIPCIVRARSNSLFATVQVEDSAIVCVVFIGR